MRFQFVRWASEWWLGPFIDFTDWHWKCLRFGLCLGPLMFAVEIGREFV